MSDIIQLLPDNIANQIAAGEVIQRPASAVKELLENAVDAGATEIRLLIGDAGKSLIQVSDNGQGMSASDAVLSFERHATSKIQKIEDLFRIRTMGFRGEALASIAAVSQIEMKTRRAEDERGVLVEIENSLVIRREPAACPVGTTILMKNLFFNVPARKNFLKSNAAEMRHIIDEFIRVALSFPDLFFSLISNRLEVFHLEKGSLKQRILQVLGNQHQAKLVTVQENTDYLNMYGFVGKPDTAKKTRGDQYLFVNNRFIKSAYLNHAVMSAYQEMIPSDSYPLYVLFIDLDPSTVDINVHPTKQEIKFEDEKLVYAFVQAAVRHALAQFSITPTLDFDLDPAIQQLDAISQPVTEEKKGAISGSSLYQTFTQKNQAHAIEPNHSSELKHWREFLEDGSVNFPGMLREPGLLTPGPQLYPPGMTTPLSPGMHHPGLLPLHPGYLIHATPSGFILIRQQSAHERIVYERFQATGKQTPMASQVCLFPLMLELSAPDAVLLSELAEDLLELGYVVEPFGRNTFVIQAIPADLPAGNEKNTLETLLEQFKHFSSDRPFSKKEKLIRSLARQRAVRSSTILQPVEMETLVNELFACSQPNITPDGKPTYLEFRKEQWERLFGR